MLKIEDELDDYLSFNIKFSSNSRRAWLVQPHLILKLETKFGEQVQKSQNYKTPGTPSLNLVCNTEPHLALSKELHKKFCSGVGMLLWLVKHSWPDIATCVRELSKVLDGTTEAAYKEMLFVIKYVLDTKKQD